MDRGRLRTFLLGGAAGLLAGVLLAPRSGRELRGTLADRAGEARERGRESFFERREERHERRSARREERGRPAERAPQSTPGEAASEVSRPRLRDVSAGDEGQAGDAERSEELRRKIRETRERLRGRRDVGGGPEA